MQEGIRVIKLTSGDTIVAKLTKLPDHGRYVQLDDPVEFTLSYNGNGEGTLLAKQWLETDETTFKIPKAHVVAEATPNNMLKDYYMSSLEEMDEMIDESFYVDNETTIH